MADANTISSISHEKRKFEPPSDFREKAYVKTEDEYKKIYEESIKDPEKFWGEKAKELHWFKPWNTVFTWDKDAVKFTWFDGGKTNVCYNCIDRHLEERSDKVAIIWQGEPEDDMQKITYKELHERVSKFANVLKKKGVGKGDRVCIYLPMVPELAVAMLACSRIGAMHSIVFAGFSADSLKDRILDSKCRMLITADGGLRGGRKVDLKGIADEALDGADCIESVIVVKRAGNEHTMKEGRDVYWYDEYDSDDITTDCPCEEMEAEDPFFILYTSGTTGKPKGVLHTTGGYLTYVNQTFKYVFDYHEDDIYWCTADIGWITGHSYIIYGPLSNGATSVMFEGVPTYPDSDRFWQVVEKFKVNIFYTAPTAIRAVARFGTEPIEKHDMSTVKLLGSVGEPINPEAWMWYYENIGKGRAPIVDTYWQSETGGILICSLPGAVAMKPGSAGRPFFGVEPAVLKEDGSPADVNEGGYLVFKKPWPGMMRTVYGNHQRFIDTYWSRFPGIYFAGDGARIDEDGDHWLMGRIDDVVNVSGHRLGTAEIESALVSHKSVAEAAVVPFPHDIKGQALYCFVTLNRGIEKTDELKKELRDHVGKEVGPIAKPDKIQFADALPKTRSGKIMRRILKALAEGKDDVGNTTTLADPSVVDDLISNRK